MGKLASLGGQKEMGRKSGNLPIETKIFDLENCPLLLFSPLSSLTPWCLLWVPFLPVSTQCAYEKPNASSDNGRLIGISFSGEEWVRLETARKWQLLLPAPPEFSLVLSRGNKVRLRSRPIPASNLAKESLQCNKSFVRNAVGLNWMLSELGYRRSLKCRRVGLWGQRWLARCASFVICSTAVVPKVWSNFRVFRANFHREKWTVISWVPIYFSGFSRHNASLPWA